MMTTKKIFLICTGIFLGVILLGSSFTSASDGNDVIGFPFTFYQYLGGKKFPEPVSRHSFNAVIFLADLLISFGIPFSILFYLNRKK